MAMLYLQPNSLNESSFYHMSPWAGLEYADDHVTLQCVKVCIPAEQKQEWNEENMRKVNQKHVYWRSG